MRPYTLFFVPDQASPADAVPSFRLVVCADDRQARLEAERELARSDRHDQVDVVDESGRSFRVSRSQPSPDA